MPIPDVHFAFILGLACILKELDVGHSVQVHLVVYPQRVGVVSDVLDAFVDVGVFEDGLGSLVAVVGGGGEGQGTEGLDVDKS